jgi:hypothetical protein
MPDYDSIQAAGAAFTRDYWAMYPRERALFNYYPGGAAHAGVHTGDGLVPDYTPANVARRLRAVGGWGETLAGLDDLARTPGDRRDLAILRWVNGAEWFTLTEIRPHRTVPGHYADTVDVSGYLRRDYAPFEERLRGLAGQLEAIPDALAVARANLDAPIAAAQLANARGNFAGHRVFIGEHLAPLVAPCPDVALRERIARAARGAVAALDEFDRFLASKEAGAAEAGYAFGTARFLGLLRAFDLVDLPLDELRRHGQADLDRNRALLEETCARIDAKAPTREVVARLAADHPPADGLVAATRRTLESLRDFTIARDLVGIPSEERCDVGEMPPYYRWAFAMMDYPGAFEPEGGGAHYWITSPDPAWPAADQEAWLRRFSHASVANTSAHEAYPGHFVQSMHNRRAPSDIARSFGAFTHWEGWAHYVEELLVEVGYGGDDPALRVAQLQDALLRNARYLVAIGLHCDGMTVEEATDLIADAALLERLPASREALRGTFDPGYGSYNLGKQMLRKLRRDAEREAGSAFSLRAFHDAVLGHGGPPFPILRPLVLREDDGRPL